MAGDPRRGDVLIVDDDPTVYDDLSRYFAGWRVHAAYSARDGLATLERLAAPALVLVDLNMPGSDYRNPRDPRGPFEIVRRATRRAPRPIVIVLTAHITPDTANATLRAGGELMAKQGCQRVLPSIVNRLTAQRHAGASIAGAVASLAARHDLTPRQVEAVALLAQNKRRDEIAAAMNVSRNTVKTTLRRAKQRCGVSTIAELRDLIAGQASGGGG